MKIVLMFCTVILLITVCAVSIVALTKKFFNEPPDQKKWHKENMDDK